MSKITFRNIIESWRVSTSFPGISESWWKRSLCIVYNMGHCRRRCSYFIPIWHMHMGLTSSKLRRNLCSLNEVNLTRSIVKHRTPCVTNCKGWFFPVLSLRVGCMRQAFLTGAHLLTKSHAQHHAELPLKEGVFSRLLQVCHFEMSLVLLFLRL